MWTGNPNNDGGEKVSLAVFNEMKELVLGQCMEPENTKKSKVKCSSDVPVRIWKNLVRLMMLGQANKPMQT